MGSARSVRTRRSKKSKRETSEPRKEVMTMWNTPSEDRLSRIPRLYETEHILLQDKLIYLHFFIGGCDWYIAEYDREDIFWGFVILNDDFQNAEWGYISLSELKSVKVGGWLEIDCELEEFWRVRKASEIEKIRKAHGWKKTNDYSPK
jgi:hypothetical protein